MERTDEQPKEINEEEKIVLNAHTKYPYVLHTTAIAIVTLLPSTAGGRRRGREKRRELGPPRVSLRSILDMINSTRAAEYPAAAATHTPSARLFNMSSTLR